MGDKLISIEPDKPYLEADKPFMAAVSPLFFTHYGKTGDFAFNKNWIYRSDDLLYPNRWAQIISQPASKSPEMVQVLSWNDYGESHNIAPVLGAEPGSSQWTKSMDHIAFREMTTYFINRWRDGAPEVYRNEITVWMWYRPHPKQFSPHHDGIGRPHNSAWVSMIHRHRRNADSVSRPRTSSTLWSSFPRASSTQSSKS
jgi:glucan endo-1,3-alpha-glucosidase